MGGEATRVGVEATRVGVEAKKGDDMICVASGVWSPEPLAPLLAREAHCRSYASHSGRPATARMISTASLCCAQKSL